MAARVPRFHLRKSHFSTTNRDVLFLTGGAMKWSHPLPSGSVRRIRLLFAGHISNTRESQVVTWHISKSFSIHKTPNWLPWHLPNHSNTSYIQIISNTQTKIFGAMKWFPWNLSKTFPIQVTLKLFPLHLPKSFPTDTQQPNGFHATYPNHFQILGALKWFSWNLSKSFPIQVTIKLFSLNLPKLFPTHTQQPNGFHGTYPNQTPAQYC